MTVATTLSLADFLRDHYIPLRLYGRSKNTIKTYANAVSYFSRLLCRPALLADLTDRTLATSLTRAAEAGAVPATINGIRGCLQAIGNYAWKKGLLPESPYIPKLVEDDPVTSAYSESDVAKILDAADGRPITFRGGVLPCGWRALILLLWYTGLRITAALSIRQADCQLPFVSVAARNQKQKRGQVFILAPDACEAIAPILRTQRPLLFGGVGKNRLRVEFTELLRLAGLPTGPRDKFQRIRRSTGQAVDRIGGNATLYLGHSSPAITQRHYLGVKPVDCTILPRPRTSGQRRLF